MGKGRIKISPELILQRVLQLPSNYSLLDANVITKDMKASYLELIVESKTLPDNCVSDVTPLYKLAKRELDRIKISRST